MGPSTGEHVSLYDVRVPEDGSIVEIAGLELADGRVTVLFGPNGAGKTTVLRALAGIGDAAPMLAGHYMPQRPYLFRGTAGWNLGLGLDHEESAWARQHADELGVAGLLGEPSGNLSGGETQRLALARTLARREHWLFLDEPLAAVDHSDKQMVLSRVASALEGRSAVVVTHDLGVAVALADDVAVIDKGRILQQGPLSEVLPSPSSLDVARILGVQNVIEGLAIPGETLTTVKSETLEVVGRGTVEGKARAMFPGEAVTIAPEGSETGSARNHWRGTVVELKPLGGLTEVVVDVGTNVVAVVTSGALGDLDVAPGLVVTVAVKATAVVVTPA